MTKTEIFLAIVAIAGILKSVDLAVKLKQARHPIILNCKNQVVAYPMPEKLDIWANKQ